MVSRAASAPVSSARRGSGVTQDLARLARTQRKGSVPAVSQTQHEQPVLLILPARKALSSLQRSVSRELNVERPAPSKASLVSVRRASNLSSSLGSVHESVDEDELEWTRGDSANMEEDDEPAAPGRMRSSSLGGDREGPAILPVPFAPTRAVQPRLGAI